MGSRDTQREPGGPEQDSPLPFAHSPLQLTVFSCTREFLSLSPFVFQLGKAIHWSSHRLSEVAWQVGANLWVPEFSHCFLTYSVFMHFQKKRKAAPTH